MTGLSQAVHCFMELRYEIAAGSLASAGVRSPTATASKNSPQFARLLRSRPSGVRGPVLLPPSPLCDTAWGGQRFVVFAVVAAQPNASA